MWKVDDHLTVLPLRGEHTAEATAYLEAKPIETAYARGLIRDNGIEDAQNRGDFYACRGRDGRLRGVALLGEAILFTSDDEGATDALARFARQRFTPRLIRGECGAVGRFWETYAGVRSASHAPTGEHLLAMRAPVEGGEAAPGLRPATLEDLPLLVKVNAGLLRAEGGRDPLEGDPDGFCRRLAQRIERGRVWVWRDGDGLIFKTDLLADTPQAVYIEGVYVAPEWRGRGVGLRCLRRLGRALLDRSAAVCLTVRKDNDGARALYRKAGFQLHSEHATVYLQQSQRCTAA